LSRRDGSTKDRGERAKKAFDWTRQIKEFLSRLRDPLSATIKFWERFNSSDGDIGFFLDVNSSDKKNRVNLALREIKETFETLEELQRTLDTLVKSCDDYANAVSSSQILQHSIHCLERILC
jgi:hypothetical protein